MDSERNILKLLEEKSSIKQKVYKITKEGDHNIKKELFHLFEEEEGFPDGVTVDEDGSIWIAHWGSGLISKQSPDGKILNRINLPSKNLTSLCFGGDHYNDLIVTSATDGMTEKDWNYFPESGKTFVIKTEEHGIEENYFIT